MFAVPLVATTYSDAKTSELPIRPIQTATYVIQVTAPIWYLLARRLNLCSPSDLDGRQGVRTVPSASVTETVSHKFSAKTAIPWVTSVVVGVILLIAFVAPLHSGLRLTIFPQDEGLLLVYPSLLLKGEIPNHSFESVYGVTNLWIIGAAFKVAGYTVTVERAVGIAYRFVIFGSLAVLAWRHRGRSRR